MSLILLKRVFIVGLVTTVALVLLITCLAYIWQSMGITILKMKPQDREVSCPCGTSLRAVSIV